MPKSGIDDIDKRILRELAGDARISNVDLAKKVGMSSAQCWSRVKALEDGGVLQRSTVAVDHAALGYPDIAVFEIALEKHSAKSLDDFARAIADLPEVLEVLMLTGKLDFMVKVAVDGTKGYERFLRERLYKIPGIQQVESSFVIRTVKRELSVIL
jgi:Lrp/AsnC family leucine-responsive transcriptional regulator